MATRRAASGEVINLRPLGPPLDDSQSTTLLRDSQLKVMRLVMLSGKELPDHARVAHHLHRLPGDGATAFRAVFEGFPHQRRVPFVLRAPFTHGFQQFVQNRRQPIL